MAPQLAERLTPRAAAAQPGRSAGLLRIVAACAGGAAGAAQLEHVVSGSAPHAKLHSSASCGGTSSSSSTPHEGRDGSFRIEAEPARLEAVISL